MKTIVSFLLDNASAIAVFFIALSIILAVSLVIADKKLNKAKAKANKSIMKFEFLHLLSHPVDIERRLRFALIPNFDANDLKDMHLHIINFIETRMVLWDARRLGEAVKSLDKVRNDNNSVENLKSFMKEAISNSSETVVSTFLFNSFVARISYYDNLSRNASEYNHGIAFLRESLKRWDKKEIDSMMAGLNKMIEAKKSNNGSDAKEQVLLQAEFLKISSLFKVE